MPMPDEAPVTIARLPVRSIPAATSAAVERKPNGVLIRVIADSVRQGVTASQLICISGDARPASPFAVYALLLLVAFDDVGVPHMSCARIATRAAQGAPLSEHVPTTIE